jgi:hypothetical protein
LAGVAYRNDYAVVFRVQDGRIAAVTEYTDLDHMRKVLFPETRSVTRALTPNSRGRQR